MSELTLLDGCRLLPLYQSVVYLLWPFDVWIVLDQKLRKHLDALAISHKSAVKDRSDLVFVEMSHTVRPARTATTETTHRLVGGRFRPMAAMPRYRLREREPLGFGPGS